MREATSEVLLASVEAGMELLTRLADSALKLVSMPQGLSGTVTNARTILERRERDNLEVRTDAQRFNLLFERAVSLLLTLRCSILCVATTRESTDCSNTSRPTYAQSLPSLAISPFRQIHPLIEAHPDLIPVPLILRNYELTSMSSFNDLLQAWWDRVARGIRWLLDDERLCPGLNVHSEAANPEEPTDIVPRRVQLVRESGCRWLVTARPSGFEGLTTGARMRIPGRQLWVLPFNQTQVRQFVQRWYALRKTWVKDQHVVLFFQFVTNHRYLKEAPSGIRRADIAALRNELSRPDTIAARFPEPLRAHAEEDWGWVLQQPWSPVDAADILLEHMPQELDISKETVSGHFHKWLKEWLADEENAHAR